jgi:ribosomal protein L31E
VNADECSGAQDVKSKFATRKTEIRRKRADTPMYEIRAEGTKEYRKMVIDTVELHDQISQIVWDVGVPGGIRTRVTAVKGRCPRPG